MVFLTGRTAESLTAAILYRCFPLGRSDLWVSHQTEKVESLEERAGMISRDMAVVSFAALLKGAMTAAPLLQPKHSNFGKLAWPEWLHIALISSTPYLLKDAGF